MHTYFLPKIGTALKLRNRLLNTKPINQDTNNINAHPEFIDPTQILLLRISQVRSTITKEYDFNS